MSKSDIQIRKSYSQKQKNGQQIDFDKEIFNKQENQSQNEKFKIINQIDINDKFILLGTMDGLYLLDVKKVDQVQGKKKRLITEDIWDCAFLPKSNYIAYCVNKSSDERQNLFIFDWKENKVVARVKMEFKIEQIKPNRSCISLTNQNQIFVIHFPSLKPIYNGSAGNGANIIYDISFQGLTLAYNSTERGQLIVRNFTNIKRSLAMSQRRKSISRVMLQKSKISSIHQSSNHPDQQEVEPKLKIKAHLDMLSQVKLSPNGSKAVTASVKGTVLRIFSTKNGNKLQQFRVGYELLKIVNINFVHDGNIIGCMNEKGNIMLYNVSMDKEQKQYETQRRGHKIYTQNNPKSMFSFLSVFYPPLADSFPFNYYQLINPQYKQEVNPDMNLSRSFFKSYSIFQDQKSENKSKIGLNNSIQELDEEHFDDFIEQKERSLISQGTDTKDIQQNSQPESRIVEDKPERGSLKVTKTIKTPSTLKPQSLAVDPRRFNSKSLSKSNTYSIIDKKQSSISARTQKTKKQEVFDRPFYNLASKLYITQGNYIWAIKGYHIFGLKYDSFHGGEMVLDFTNKIQ